MNSKSTQTILAYLEPIPKPEGTSPAARNSCRTNRLWDGQLKQTIFVLGIVLLLGLKSTTSATQVASFDDISFWAGSSDGENEAAIVIDWNGESNADDALVWGFRWSGSATGETMLQAVLAADHRLFARLGDGSGGLGTPVYGLGYDENNDGQLETLPLPSLTFGPNGILTSGIPDQFFAGATGVSPDRYREGWQMSGFWNYGISTAAHPFENGGHWTQSGSGASGRQLTNGDWDSWAFTPFYDFAAFAENANAAELPTMLVADFNGDGMVDAADFTRWQENYGEQIAGTLPLGDADSDGDIDGSDFLIWQQEFTPGTALLETTTQSTESTEAATENGFAVPEPNAQRLMLGCIGVFFMLFVYKPLFFTTFFGETHETHL